MTHVNIIRGKLLVNGSITKWDAYKMGITTLAQRIADLKDEGMIIKSVFETRNKKHKALFFLIVLTLSSLLLMLSVKIAIIALMAAATFSILDTFVPTMGASARSGAGFGIGANLVGFPRLG